MLYRDRAVLTTHGPIDAAIDVIEYNKSFGESTYFLGILLFCLEVFQPRMLGDTACALLGMTKNIRGWSCCRPLIDMVGTVGIEPTTCRLRVGCSTS